MVPGAMVVAAHAAGRLHRGGRHHRARRADTAGGGHSFPHRLEHQDHDGGVDRAARPGRQTEVQRSRGDVRPGRAQRREHHRRRAFEDAQRPLRLHRRPRALGRHGCRPEEGVDAAGGAGHRVPAPAAVRARRLLRVQQHQLRIAGPHRREGRRAPVGPAVPGPALRSARPRADVASRRRRHRHPGSLLTRLHVRRKLLRTRRRSRIPPTCRPPHGPEHCSRSTTPTRTPPTPPPPGARSPRPTTWRRGCRALVSGKVFNADFHRQWLASLQAEDPDAPDGQKYGYGISYQRFGPNAAMYYHGGELPGFNSFMGYDPDNDVTLVIWTNLTLSPDGRTTAQAMLAAAARRDLRRPVAGAADDPDDHQLSVDGPSVPGEELAVSADNSPAFSCNDLQLQRPSVATTLNCNDLQLQPPALTHLPL